MSKKFWCFALISGMLAGWASNISAQTWTPQTPPSAHTLRAVHFIDGNEGWAAGYDGIIHTSDGGSAWTAQLSNSPYRLIAIRFVDASHGWANAGLKVFRTQNGGSSWKDMTGIDPHAAIFRNVIFPVSPDVAWATAQANGQRWYYRYTATSATAVAEQAFGVIGSWSPLYDLWFTDQDNGWAVGMGGQIWKITGASTDNPGFTNQSDADATSNTLRGVFFLDLNHGWAVGDNGTIIGTADGGTTWSSIPGGTTSHLRDVHFNDLNSGCVVGDGGLILVTTDGGVSWSVQSSNVTTTLYGVCYAGTAPGFIVGGEPVTSGNGTILRTDNPLTVPETGGLQSAFTLGQNYPNPFSRSTEIGFYVARNGLVSLKVYNMLGSQVATLVEKELQQGHYSITFDASMLPGGMYFYRLQSRDFDQTRKLMLQKQM